MLIIDHVTKFYHDVAAVKNVSFTVPEGCVSVLVGPNGAGKSTLFKSIMNILRYEGLVTMEGIPTRQPEGRQYLGYVPELPALYPLLTVREHLEFSARIYGVKDWATVADRLLERFDLDDKQDKLGSELSKGMQQKVSICATLIARPKMILFDEPMMGLDPKAIKELKKIFFELKASGVSSIISTHILESVEDLWEQAMIMQDGELRSVVTHNELTAQGTNLTDYFFTVTEVKPEEVREGATA
ncbi:MAG: ABC transporter ATP-binding protein [Fastidiosipilaceae bacterium]|jgi:ABC-2 type transport system ATP-binding protein|nr:ABC transporter ATP-binding protein [Clostridiaceae bacterium]